MAQESTPFDLDFDIDEDLFNFDDLLKDSGNTMAELDAALDATMETVVNLSAPASKSKPAPAPVATFTPPAQPAPLSPQQVQKGVARRKPKGAPAATDAAAETERTQTRPRASRFVLVGVVGSLVLNVLLLAFAIPALRAVRDLAQRDTSGTVAAAPSSETLPPLGGAELAQPGRTPSAPASEGERALERAREALAAGEFERSRQILCSLLAIADRLSSGERRDVEARARFMLADTWRLEADAVELAAGRDLALAGEEPQR